MSPERLDQARRDGGHFSRRSLSLLVVAAAVLAGGIGAMLILVAPQPAANLDDVRTAQSETPASGETEESLVESDEPRVLAAGQPPTTYEVFLDRDPFSRVVPVAEVEPGDGASPADSSTPVAPGDPFTSTVPADRSTPTPTVDPSAPATPEAPGGPDSSNAQDGAGALCTGSQELVCGQQVVTLEELREVDDEEVATIRVDDSDHEVRQGESFATWFNLGSVDRPCVRLLYGDESFQLCSGQPVMK